MTSLYDHIRYELSITKCMQMKSSYAVGIGINTISKYFILLLDAFYTGSVSIVNQIPNGASLFKPTELVLIGTVSFNNKIKLYHKKAPAFPDPL